MTPDPHLLNALAIVVLCAVATRLARLEVCDGTVRCRVTWHLWVLGQVSIAVGALSLIANWHAAVLPFTFTGLALQYGVRIHRRSTDR